MRVHILERLFLVELHTQLSNYEIIANQNVYYPEALGKCSK